MWCIKWSSMTGINNNFSNSRWTCMYVSHGGACRIEWVCWRDLWNSSHPINLCKQGPPRADCLGICPGWFWRSQSNEAPKPLWATFASAPSPIQWRHASWCLHRISCVLVCTHCLLSLSQGTSEKNLHCILSSGIHWWDRPQPKPSLLG